jgi:serine/threonine protein kinase
MCAPKTRSDLGLFGELYRVEVTLFNNGKNIVSTGTSRLNNKKVIIKSVITTQYKKMQEAAILRRLQCVPGVIVYVDHFYVSSNRQIMVTEYFGDSNLTRFMKMSAPLSENTSHTIAKQLVAVVQTCFNLNILHAKIVPANILINAKSLQIKLHNFDNACTFVKDDHPTVSLCESICPPEYFTTQKITAEGYYVWTLGLILYELLFNCKPFLSKKAIVNASCMAHTPKPIDINAFVLIAWMLAKNPRHRIPLFQIQHHPWMSKKY